MYEFVSVQNRIELSNLGNQYNDHDDGVTLAAHIALFCVRGRLILFGMLKFCTFSHET